MLKKRIPTILGILLLLVGITAGVYLVELGPQSLTTRAGPEYTPSHVAITNITDHSFTVSWLTETLSLGFVRYGTSGTALDLSALDDRTESEESDQTFITHHATVENLSPNTTYYFEIISGTGTTSFTNNGEPYTATTASTFSPSVSADTAYGAVYFPDLSPAEGALVYVTLEGGSPLSSLVASTGTWGVPLSSMRTADLASTIQYDPSETTLTIRVVGSDGTEVAVTTTTGSDTPVDDIVLSKMSEEVAEIQEDATSSATTSQFSLTPLADLPETEGNSVTVVDPSEGEAINTPLPEFHGSGTAGRSITAIVESEQPLQATVQVDALGQWSWSPSVPLDPGEHQLTIRWLDQSGIVRSISRSFVVYAQGESSLPAFESTPSATATPTPVELAAITPTPIPTARPTTSPQPTVPPTITVTPTPSPRPSPTPEATTPALPVPGSGAFSVILILSGLSLTVSGALLLSRKSFLL